MFKKYIFSLLIILVVHCTLINDTCNSQWVQTEGIFGGSVFSMAGEGNFLYAGADSEGIFRTTNNGINWSRTALDGTIYEIMIAGNYIFAYQSNGLYISTNNGSNWTRNTFDKGIYTMLAIGNIIFAGTSLYGVYYSTNYGDTWGACFNRLCNNSFVD